MNDEEDFYLLGFALYGVQAFEFGLYGIASHCSHLPDAQSERRFRDLDPEKFLRGDISDLKATLGQIVRVFGDSFLIGCDELDAFIGKRNDIAHNIWRFTNTSLHPSPIADIKQYLKDFIAESKYWRTIIRGLTAAMRVAAAEAEGRSDELSLSDEDKRCMDAFYEHAARCKTNGQPDADAV